MPAKIIIRTPNWLGDLMMSTSFIQTILQRFPDSQIDLIVKKGFETLPLPKRGEIISFDKKQESSFQLGKKLKKNNYDKFYVLPPSFSSALVAYLANAPQTYGYKQNLRGFLLNRGKQYKAKHRSIHLVQEYHNLIDDNLSPSSPYLEIDNAWLNKELNQLNIPEKIQLNKTIIFAPSAIYGPSKQWPKEYWKELGWKLFRMGISTIVSGTKNDIELGDFISEGNPACFNFCGKTSLNELIALMKESLMLVSNDSGAMHMMAALQKKQVAIFGSTSTTWTAPLNQRAKIIHLNKPCSPCYQRTCKFSHYDCLNDIGSNLVLENINQLLL